MLTNWTKTVLYTGVTNDIAMRLVEHWIGRDGCFTSRYHVYYLIWYEETQYVLNAIRREKEIKNVTRKTKEALIAADNKDWIFRNEQVLGNWPPTQGQIEAVMERWRREETDSLKNPMSFLRQLDREKGWKGR